MMTQNVWTINERITQGDKNFIVLSLHSLGRADLSSVPAGGTRANKRTQTIKGGVVDFVFNGNRSSIKASKPASAKPKPSKPAKVANARSSQPKRNPPRKAGSQQLVRPLGFPRPKWNALSTVEKEKLIKAPVNRVNGLPAWLLKSKPPQKPARVYKHTPPKEDYPDMKKEFVPSDFGWSQDTYDMLFDKKDI